MWQFTIHRSFRPSPVILWLAILGNRCAQRTMFPTLKTCKATAAGGFLTCTDFDTGSRVPELSGIVVTRRANQYSTNAPSSFRSLIQNNTCSCLGRHPFGVRTRLPGALLYAHPVVPSIPSAPALASSGSRHPRYAFTFSTLILNVNTMVNTELHCLQLFIWYIRLVRTLIIDKCPPAAVSCHAVRCVSHIVD